MEGKGAARVTDAVSHSTSGGGGGGGGKGGGKTAAAAKAAAKKSAKEKLLAKLDAPSETAASRRAAFLQAIRVFEGTAGPDGARTMYGGNLAPDLSDHPRDAAEASFEMGGKTYTTHAAGAYQFQPGTWDTYKNQLDLPDFSQASQDRAALADIASHDGGAPLDAIDRGDVESAAKGLNREWTSLPGGPQTRGSPADLREAYELALDGRPVTSLSDLPSRRLPRLQAAADKADAKAADAEAQAAKDEAEAAKSGKKKDKARAAAAKSKAEAARARADKAKKALADAKAGAPPKPAPADPKPERAHAPPGPAARVAAAGGGGGQTASGGSGEVQEGSPNVKVEGQPAARAGVDHAKCDRHPAKLIAEGSATVLVNGKPFARLGDLTECNAAHASSSATVIVGGPTATTANVRGMGGKGGGIALLGVIPQAGVARAAASGRVIAGRGDGSTLYAEEGPPTSGTGQAARTGGGR